MDFNINELETKNDNELRQLFSGLSKKDGNIVKIRGDFSRASLIVKTLVYLPRHITTVEFDVTFYRRVARDDIIEYVDYLNEIQSSIRFLPSSINTFCFNVSSDTNTNNSQTTAAIARILKKLPETITHLTLNFDFGWGNTAQNKAVFANIPISVQSLTVRSSWGIHGDKMRQAFPAIRSNIVQLSLAENLLGNTCGNDGAELISAVPAHIKELDLGKNDFNFNVHAYREYLFSQIPQTLESLNLSHNLLRMIDIDALFILFAKLPKKLKRLDIAGNGLLNVSLNEFKALIFSFPPTLNALRFSQYDANGLSDKGLRARFALLPPTMKTIGFSNVGWFGFTVSGLLNLIEQLPTTIDCLDLSSNQLGSQSIDELIYLIRKLPQSIHQLKLSNNGLSCLDLPVLKALLFALPSHITEIDLSNNGFGQLYFSQRELIWRFIPPTIRTVILGGNELTLRNDGTLMPPFGMPNEHFFTEKRFINQQEYSNYRMNTMHTLPIMQKLLPPEVVSSIFSYVFNYTNRKDLKQLLIIFSMLIISSVPPNEITKEQEDECLAAVNQRIAQRKSDNPWLDLSRCGLNRLVTDASQKKFRAILRKLPECVDSLKLRGNGFQTGKRSLEVFLALMPKIPDRIHSLDLSDNGFEREDAQTLAQLFADLPPFINQIILDREPLSPAVQIAKREWPESYWTLTEQTSDKLQQARALFDDYTKGDSAFWRFFYGHWNRSYTHQAGQIVYAIDKGLMNEDDLKEIIASIKPINQVGSLAKRCCFFTYHKPRPQAVVLGDESDEENTVELQVLDYHCFSK